MWRIGDKRPSRRSSCSVLGEQLSPGEPPSKRAKVSEERINNPPRRRSWWFKVQFRSVWNTVVGGFRHVARWARRQPPSTDMEYLHPNTPVPTQQLSSPTYTSTPSQSLTPMTSVQSTDASPVGTPHTSLLDSSSHNTSAQPSNHGHPEIHSLKPSYSITQKPVQHKSLQERGYSNEPLSQLQKQVAQKKLKKGSGQGEGPPSRETQRLATEEGPSPREAQWLATEQPVREKSRVNVDKSPLKEEYHFEDGGRSLRGGKGVQVSAIQRISMTHTSAGAAFGGSPYSPGVSTPASQGNRGISLFAPMLHPEVIGPSLPSSRSIRTTESSFTISSSVYERSVTRHSVTGQERRKSPTTISSVSQSPWQPTPPVGRVELARERGRESAIVCDEGESRGQSAQQLSHARGQNAQQVRKITNMLERIRLEQAHSVEDRKTMAELIEKKIHLYQSERMMIEDARVSRLRQQLASTGVSQEEPGKEDDLQPHIETLQALSDSQITKVHGAVSGGSSSECLSHKFNIRITRGDIGTLVGLQWLNDEVINFYFNMIKERSLENGSAKRVHVFNTFFYSKLSKAGYSGVRRWTKKVDIFEFDMVLVPVHMGMHWCLAAIDFGTKCVSYYDSLHGNNGACLQRLRDYLSDESRDKKGVDFDLSSWASSTPKDIPHQLNGSDCGVFACMYARFLSVGSPFDFSQADMPDIRNHMIAEILEQKLF